MWNKNFKPNRKGLEELARGPIAQGVVRTHTEQKRSAAGDGFRASYTQGRRRFVGIVFADTYSAMRREARDNVLVRVLG
ncbi:hypothetical protein [Corynebacterium sp.]|uniref:hypothetical protein n=1 Tax=Corynebacterium sp. TaxID=1720 RepID=UPI0028AD1D06|nr:hypothetical protein [Corynebacterium sp.]